MNRAHRHYILHYVVLPVMLVGSDIFIGVFGHYNGYTDNLLSMFSWENIVDYVTNSWQEILMVVGVAFIILVLVEYLIRDVVAHNKKKG